MPAFELERSSTETDDANRSQEAVELSRSTVCGIIVTFNPDEFSVTCVRKIIAGISHTIVVDNRSDKNLLPELRELPPETFTLIENPRNVGVAAALNQGIRLALEKGYQGFLLFDQDTDILHSTIDELILTFNECSKKLGSRFGYLGSNFFHQRECGAIDDANVPFTLGSRWVQNRIVITSGTLISRESYRTIGSFREDFFIDHVDHEYYFRTRRSGLIVCKTAEPVIVHRLGKLGRRKSWIAFGRLKTLSNYSPLRRYYQIRNFKVLSREFAESFPTEVCELRKGIRRDLRRALKYEGSLVRLLISISLAYWHSKRGVLGRYRGRFL